MFGRFSKSKRDSTIIAADSHEHAQIVSATPAAMPATTMTEEQINTEYVLRAHAPLSCPLHPRLGCSGAVTAVSRGSGAQI